ncbi:MAG TPA: DUF6297 family protein [Nocardioidaceae bacterium]|nr:DUF6297 family protein [Nocardioidaceae bacterium]
MSRESAREIRELRATIRHWRRGRVDTRFVDAFNDAYVAVFATLMLGAMAVNVVINLRAVGRGGCTSGLCVQARTTLPWLLVIGVAAACLGVARLFGPMLVTPAVGTWLLPAPVDRAALLRPRLVATCGAALLAGALLALASSALASFAVGAVVAFSVVVAAGCALLVAVAVVDQARGLGVTGALTWLVAAVSWAGLVALSAGRAPDLQAATAYGPGWPAAAGVAGVLMMGAAALAARSLPLLSADRLKPGGSLVPSLSGALATVDLALIYDIMVARRWLARSTVRSVRARRRGPTGGAALVWRDLIRVRRAPQRLVVLAASLVVPYLGAAAGLGRVLVLAASVTGFVAGLGLCSAVRVVSRNPGLARCLPMPTWQTRGSCLVVPGALLLAWGLGTAPAFHATLPALPGGDWPLAVDLGIATGFAALVAITRWLTAAPPDYQKPLLSSPTGAVPTSLFGALGRGLDVLLLLTAPILLSPTPTGAVVSIGIGVIVLGVLLNRERS